MEPYIVRLTDRGQLTLPASIRRRLGLGKGTKLFVLLNADEIRLKRVEGGHVPVFTEKSGFLDLIGSFEGPSDLSENHNSYLTEES